MRIPCTALSFACLMGTASAAGLTDMNSHPVPAITIPPAGGSYIDPVFGTRIIRVTDSRDGRRCTHSYSYWPAFNSDGTRLMLACDDVIRLYRFDPATDQLTADGTLRGADGYDVQFDGATWSHSLNASSTVYALDRRGTRLWRIVVSKRGLAGYTLLKDFGATITGRYANQLSVSNDGDVYTFYTRDNATNAHKDVVVWERSINKTRIYPRPAGRLVNESHVNKDGTAVMINFEDDSMALWSFREGTETQYSHASLVDNVSGHFDLGQDFVANSDGVATGLCVRTWGSTRNPENIVQYKRVDGSLNWTLSDHVSLREDNEEWVVASTYVGDGTDAPFEDEIYLARTDGGGFVRLAHSRSLEANSNPLERYFAQPRAVIDRSGRYIVFTSDLGSTSRFDVMLLKVPSAYWPN